MMDRSITGKRGLRTNRFLLLLSTIVGTAVAQPARAQMAAPAPVRPSVDANGVDLFLGTFNTRGAPLVLGKSGGEGLTYQQVNTGTGWTDNTTVTLNLSGNVMTVILGGSSDTFTVSGSTYTATEGNGATLTASGTSFIYTRSDGTVVHFDSTRAGTYPYYSNYGRVTNITSPSGLALTFAYYSISYCSRSKPGGNGDICTQHNSAYRVTTVTSSAGYSLTFNYGELDPYDADDPSNQPNFQEFSTVLSVSSANTVTGAGGPSESFGYNGSAYSIADAAGRTTTYQMSGGAIAAIQLPGSSGNDVTVAYSGGRVSGITTVSGTTGYSATDNGGARTVTVTDPASHATTYVFDIGSQRINSVTDALGNVTRSAYDTSGRLTSVINPGGDGVGYTYDGYGNIIATTANGQGGGSWVMTTASYPCSGAATCNKPQWTKDGNGNETDYAYDPATGEVTSVTLPAGASGIRPQTRYTYTSVGGVSLPAGISQCQTGSSCAGGADETKTTIAYNANLLPTSVSTGAGDGSLTAASAFTYDAVGNVLSVDGPLPGSADTTAYSYDADREVTQVVGPDPDGSGPLNRRSVAISYLPTGQVSGKTLGSVDSSGRFTALQQQSSGYDSGHRKIADTITAGGTTYAVTQYSYDAYGRPMCTAQRMNPSSWTSQGDACQLAAAGSYGNDRINRIAAYDALNRATQVTSGYGTPEAATEQTAFTASGKTQSVTDANGNVTTYGYDTYDRPVTTTYPGGSYEQLTFDVSGNVIVRRLRDGNSITYTYDALNRVTAKAAGSEASVGYGYDLLGRLVSTSRSDIGTNTLAYDALGRLTADNQPFGAMTYQYDVAGRRIRTTWGDGFFVSYDYDTVGEMTAVHENGGLVLASFAYDDLSRRTSLSRANGTATSYGYDAVSRLASLTQDLTGTSSDLTLGFAYNPAGQIASRSSSNDAYAFTQSYNVNRTYTANGLNQYTQTGSIAPTYDGRGNLTGAGSTTYGYGLENLLKTASGTATLYYDALNRLAEYDASVSTRFAYDGGNIATEIQNGAVARRYVYGSGSDEPVVWYEGAGTSDRRYLHADERGSVIAVSDGSGNASVVDAYDEYGIPASTNQGRFQYTGQAWLAELGMQYSKARIYSPTLGRFLQTDPIGYGDGLNGYNYVGSDPINATDPSGLEAYTCVGGKCYDSKGNLVSGGTSLKVGDTVSSAGQTFTSNGAGGGVYDIIVNGSRSESSSTVAPSTIVAINTKLLTMRSTTPQKPNPCTMARRTAGQLAKAFNNASTYSGALSLTFAGATALGVLGEGITFGADTPATISAASLTSFFGYSSFATGAAGAALQSFSDHGNAQALANFNFSQFANLATSTLASKAGLEKYSELLGDLAEKAEDLQNAETEGCL